MRHALMARQCLCSATNLDWMSLNSTTWFTTCLCWKNQLEIILSVFLAILNRDVIIHIAYTEPQHFSALSYEPSATRRFAYSSGFLWRATWRCRTLQSSPVMPPFPLPRSQAQQSCIRGTPPGEEGTRHTPSSSLPAPSASSSTDNHPTLPASPGAGIKPAPSTACDTNMRTAPPNDNSNEGNC